MTGKKLPNGPTFLDTNDADSWGVFKVFSELTNGCLEFENAFTIFFFSNVSKT